MAIPLTLTSIQEVHSTVVEFATRNMSYNVQNNNILVTFDTNATDLVNQSVNTIHEEPKEEIEHQPSQYGQEVQPPMTIDAHVLQNRTFPLREMRRYNFVLPRRAAVPLYELGADTFVLLRPLLHGPLNNEFSNSIEDNNREERRGNTASDYSHH